MFENNFKFCGFPRVRSNAYYKTSIDCQQKANVQMNVVLETIF